MEALAKVAFLTTFVHRNIASQRQDNICTQVIPDCSIRNFLQWCTLKPVGGFC